jgi:hypothetical protein
MKRLEARMSNSNNNIGRIILPFLGSFSGFRWEKGGNRLKNRRAEGWKKGFP